MNNKCTCISKINRQHSTGSQKVGGLKLMSFLPKKQRNASNVWKTQDILQHEKTLVAIVKCVAASGDNKYDTSWSPHVAILSNTIHVF